MNSTEVQKNTIHQILNQLRTENCHLQRIDPSINCKFPIILLFCLIYLVLEPDRYRQPQPTLFHSVQIATVGERRKQLQRGGGGCQHRLPWQQRESPYCLGGDNASDIRSGDIYIYTYIYIITHICSHIIFCHCIPHIYICTFMCKDIGQNIFKFWTKISFFSFLISGVLEQD